MFKDTPVVSGFSTNDIKKAKEFYANTLGFTVDENEGGILTVHFANGGQTFIYPKPDHQPATFTIMNIIVDDIEQAVDALRAKGITFEQYETMHTDEKGIAWGKKVNMGPNIAWFKDPAGNILSLLED